MRQIVLLIVLALLLSGAPPGFAADATSEYRVKAAYLYNFAKFIQWPESAFSGPQAPLTIGVLGRNLFNGELTQLASRQIQNRSIEIKQFSSIAEVENCQLLYLNSSGSELQRTLQALRKKPIVTVGDAEDFTENGGVIKFVTKRDRLRFVINLGVAQATDIKLAAQLLALAAEVQDAPK